MTRRSLLVAASLAFVLAATGCSTSSSAGPTTTTPAAPTSTEPATTSQPPSPLPPHELDDLAAVFDPIVQPLGYRVTRASLIDRSSLETTPDGNHLAIYLRPTGDIGDEGIAADFAPLVRTFIPFVFERYPGLESFDFCQEPFGVFENVPPSQTLFDVERSAVDSLDWSDVDLATLLDYRELDGVLVWARIGTITHTDVWIEAEHEAAGEPGD
jgi:hypothetical protein